MSEQGPSSWQTVFVVTTLVLGDTKEDAQASLSPSNWAIAIGGSPTLDHADKTKRARALAGVLADMGSELEELRLV